MAQWSHLSQGNGLGVPMVNTAKQSRKRLTTKICRLTFEQNRYSTKLRLSEGQNNANNSSHTSAYYKKYIHTNISKPVQRGPASRPARFTFLFHRNES